jgi:glucosylceramidase
VNIFVTARDTRDRLTEKPTQQLTKEGKGTLPFISVDPAEQFQTIEGFGGAFTEAAATTLFKLPGEQQAEIMRAYFDRAGGHGYSLCRTHINSCDFALGNYAYADTAGDISLAHFSIDRDRRSLIPMIREAVKVSGTRIKLLASPWSPPAWMKTNGKMNNGGKLKPEYRAVWASYYCRYIKEYGREGIPVWGLTVQNEPEAVQTWDSCVYTAEEERDFVRDFLGPALQREGLEAVRLFVWDHNRDRMYDRAGVVFDDPVAARYVAGTAFHWYCGDHFDNVGKLHDAYPEKQLLFSEGCQEGGPHIGEWEPGERYARSMINDLNRWTIGWIDWNMMLDESGGPNHQNNFCSAPVIANTKTGKVLYQSSYYYIGHFARFIRPGAKRIKCGVGQTLELAATAFINPDNRVAVVVLNQGARAIPFSLQFAGQSALIESPARSIMTLCFET